MIKKQRKILLVNQLIGFNNIMSKNNWKCKLDKNLNMKNKQCTLYKNILDLL